MGILGKLANAIDVPRPAWKTKLTSKFARRWFTFAENKRDGSPLVALDRTSYEWRRDGSLRRKRLWAKGHEGRRQRKLYRRLRRQGHHGRELALQLATR